MIPKLSGFKLLEEENPDAKDVNQDEFDFTAVNEPDDEEEDESN